MRSKDFLGFWSESLLRISSHSYWKNQHQTRNPRTHWQKVCQKQRPSSACRKIHGIIQLRSQTYRKIRGIIQLRCQKCRKILSIIQLRCQKCCKIHGVVQLRFQNDDNDENDDNNDDNDDNDDDKMLAGIGLQKAYVTKSYACQQKQADTWHRC